MYPDRLLFLKDGNPQRRPLPEQRHRGREPDQPRADDDDIVHEDPQLGQAATTVP